MKSREVSSQGSSSSGSTQASALYLMVSDIAVQMDTSCLSTIIYDVFKGIPFPLLGRNSVLERSFDRIH